VIWRRQDTTRIISLTDAPRGFNDLRSLEFEAMGRILFDGEDDAGRSVTVSGSFGTFSFLLDDPAAQKRPAVVIPIDPHYRSRCDEARRFMSHHLGFRALEYPLSRSGRKSTGLRAEKLRIGLLGNAKDYVIL
jgi:hypothetical protein